MQSDTDRLTRIEKLIGVSNNMLLYYVTAGKLQAHRDKENSSPWMITANNFAEFLCVTPKMRKLFLKSDKLDSNFEIFRKTVLQYLHNQPWYYRLTDIAELCDVSIRSVYYWVYKGYLIADMETSTSQLYSENAVLLLFKRYPKSRKFLKPSNGWRYRITW